MKLPISQRLLLCAALVPPGARVADVGCDHGYLGIHLLKTGTAKHVIATDLREKPLEKARENARRLGADGEMDFFVADGLSAVSPGQVDTIVIAGMGGDNIAAILEAAPWVKDPTYTLILQPQTSGNDLRRYLGQAGFTIVTEHLVRDGGFLYFAMVVRFGGGVPLSPGQQYLSLPLLTSGDPLLPDYFERILSALARTVSGIRAGGGEEKLTYYQRALDEVQEMRETYERTRNR